MKQPRNKRLNPKQRKRHLITMALSLAEEVGYNKITRDQLAEYAQVSMGCVTNTCGTMIKLKRSIIRAAIHNQNLVVLAQGLANKDPEAQKAPEELKQKAIMTLI